MTRARRKTVFGKLLMDVVSITAADLSQAHDSKISLMITIASKQWFICAILQSTTRTHVTQDCDGNVFAQASCFGWTVMLFSSVYFVLKSNTRRNAVSHLHVCSCLSNECLPVYTRVDAVYNVTWTLYVRMWGVRYSPSVQFSRIYLLL